MPLRGTTDENNFCVIFDGLQSASGMIKFKTGNCLNILEIVKKEPDTILLFIKNHRIVIIIILVMACSFFTISYT